MAISPQVYKSGSISGNHAYQKAPSLLKGEYFDCLVGGDQAAGGPTTPVLEDGGLWWCEPRYEAHALALMAIHAPGVAIVRQYASKDAKDGGRLPVLTGLATVRTVHGSPDPATSSLRIAIAYICCGHIPPLALTKKALSSPLPWAIDDDIAEGLDSSLRLHGDDYDYELADEVANLRTSPSPAP